MRHLAAAALAMVFAACAPSTPQSRIEANLASFSRLSDRHKELVRQGQIEQGMPPQAVYIAWGRPSRDYTGQEGNVPTRVWEYAGSQPVYSTSYYGGYGYRRYGGYGGYRRGRYDGYGVSPQVTYVPYRKATVWFLNDKVSKWERAR